jgi:hypothetical protein
MATAIGRQAHEAARSIPMAPAAVDSRESDRWIIPVAAPIVAAIVLGMALDIAPLATVAAIAAIVVALIAPIIGLAILGFMVALVPPPSIPAPGFDTILVGAILLGCIYRLPIDRPKTRASAPLLIVVAYVLYVLVQQLPEMLGGYAGQDGHDVGYLFGQLLTGFGVIVVAGYLLNGRSPYPVLAMTLAGAGVAGFLAIATYGTTVAGPPLGRLVAISGDLGRATGTFSNPNYLGTFSAIMGVAALSLLTILSSRRVRAALIGVGLVLAAAVLLSLSRGAIIAALGGIAVLVLYRSRVLAVALLGLGLLGVTVIYPAFVQWRLESLTGSASAAAYVIMTESDDSRLAGVLAAPQLFLTSPVIGIGFGHFVPMSAQVSGGLQINAHNWYLTVLAEQGVVGVVMWVLLAVAVVVALRTRAPSAQAVGFGVLGALGAAAFFLEPPTSFQMIAPPLIFVVAALVGEWGPERLAAPAPVLSTTSTRSTTDPSIAFGGS